MKKYIYGFVLVLVINLIISFVEAYVAVWILGLFGVSVTFKIAFVILLLFNLFFGKR